MIRSTVHTIETLKIALVRHEGIRQSIYGAESKPTKFDFWATGEPFITRDAQEFFGTVGENGSRSSTSHFLLDKTCASLLLAGWSRSKYGLLKGTKTAEQIFAILAGTPKAGKAEYKQMMGFYRENEEKRNRQIKAGEVIREIAKIEESVKQANTLLAALGREPIEIDLSDRVKEMQAIE